MGSINPGLSAESSFFTLGRLHSVKSVTVFRLSQQEPDTYGAPNGDRQRLPKKPTQQEAPHHHLRVQAVVKKKKGRDWV
jgi:hypothetical protein